MNSNFYAPTTGSIAAACSIAGLKAILNEFVDVVAVKTPTTTLNVFIDHVEKLSGSSAMASSHKRPYNDPDVTVNIEIDVVVSLIDFNGEKVIIKAGDGVGRVTKPGLQIEVGGPAINPVPRKMIVENLEDIIPENKTAVVCVRVPRGKEIARKTMNPKLGIVGGISILGTTGVARSMSSQAYKDSIVKQLDVAVAGGYNGLILVPGNIGEKLALKCFNLDEDVIVQTGNYVGFMFEEAAKRDISKFTYFGHIGKLIKVAGGIFNTKHAVADSRREIMITHAILAGADNRTARRLFNSKTTEDMLDILDGEGLSKEVCNSIARTINEVCKAKFGLNVNTILVDMEGNFLNDNFIQPDQF